MRKTRRTDWLACGGWTVLEITLVAGIITLVVATSAPAINRNMEQFRLDAAVYSLTEDLQLARIQALKKNTAVTLRIHTDNSSWDIQGGNTRYLTRSLGFGNETPRSLIFDSRGRCTSAGIQTITIHNSQNQTRSVTIQMSGRIAIS